MMKSLPCLAAAMLALSCGARPTFEHAAAALFEGRAEEAARMIRALAPEITEAGLSVDDLIPFTDQELQAISKEPSPPTDEKFRFLLAPRGLIAAREPTFLWESSGKDRITIKVADDHKNEWAFDVDDRAPFSATTLTIPRGTSCRWALFDLAGNPLSDWLEFKIASNEVAHRQQAMLGFLSTRVPLAAQRSLLSVQFYRRQKLFTEALSNVESLAKEYRQNARVRLEMAACLAQLGNDYAAKVFADGAGNTVR